MNGNHETTTPPVRLLWLDVETTGLDPRTDPIIEIGLLATTPRLEPLDGGYHSAIHWEGETDDTIRRMHGPNGLLAECAHPATPDMFRVMLAARDYVERHLQGHRLLPAGSSIRFDRDMIDSWMPGLLDGCSHRSLDVSALYEAIRMWNPAILPDTTGLKTTNHRVMRCLADTLRYAAAYRSLICSIG